MPYQLQKLSPPQIARLDEVPITRQEEIIDRTGEPLRLVTSYYLVKNASADFTVPHETAEQLDAAIHQLLSRRGFLDGTLQAAPKPEPPKAPVPAEKVEQSVQKAFEPVKPFSFSQYPLSRKFMPQHQQKVVQGFKEERAAIATEVEKMLAAIPKPSAQSKKPLMEQTVFAHYFYGQSDWFVLSYDASEDMFFGYVILNGDSELSEAGYFSRQELTDSGRVELDFHWKPVVLGEALHKADPDFFAAPAKASSPESVYGTVSRRERPHPPTPSPAERGLSHSNNSLILSRIGSPSLLERGLGGEAFHGETQFNEHAQKLRIAQAKAKAQAARIRILQLKSQKAV